MKLAARLLSLAGPDEIIASAETRDHVIDQMDCEIHDLGECYLRHFDRAVRAYRIVGEFEEPKALPKHLNEDDPDNLEKWASRVQAVVIDAELLSKICFDGAKLFHHHITGDAAGHKVDVEPLHSMTRPTEKQFKAQLKLVESYAQLRGDRMVEILAQIAGPIEFMSALALARPDRTRWTNQVLAASNRFSQYVASRFKHAMACRRPIEYSPQIMPPILTPGHSALPSGHATEAFTMAVVLVGLLNHSGYAKKNIKRYKTQALAMATRITVNRTVAGLHFPVDNLAGATLGIVLGHYLIARFSGAKAISCDFFGDKVDGSLDFAPKDFLETEASDILLRDDIGFIDNIQADVALPGESELLGHVWNKAKAEMSIHQVAEHDDGS